MVEREGTQQNNYNVITCAATITDVIINYD